MSLILTYVEKDEITKTLKERMEDKLESEFEKKLNLICKILDSDFKLNLNYSQRMIIIQQLELKLETDIADIMKEKYKKIIGKLNDL